MPLQHQLPALEGGRPCLRQAEKHRAEAASVGAAQRQDDLLAVGASLFDRHVEHLEAAEEVRYAFGADDDHLIRLRGAKDRIDAGGHQRFFFVDAGGAGDVVVGRSGGPLAGEERHDLGGRSVLETERGGSERRAARRIGVGNDWTCAYGLEGQEERSQDARPSPGARAPSSSYSSEAI
jgi:hypothetical protein